MHFRPTLSIYQVRMSSNYAKLLLPEVGVWHIPIAWARMIRPTHPDVPVDVSIPDQAPVVVVSRRHVLELPTGARRTVDDHDLVPRSYACTRCLSLGLDRVKRSVASPRTQHSKASARPLVYVHVYMSIE